MRRWRCGWVIVRWVCVVDVQAVFLLSMASRSATPASLLSLGPATPLLCAISSTALSWSAFDANSWQLFALKQEDMRGVALIRLHEQEGVVILPISLAPTVMPLVSRLSPSTVALVFRHIPDSSLTHQTPPHSVHPSPRSTKPPSHLASYGCIIRPPSPRRAGCRHTSTLCLTWTAGRCWK